jgi:hypothetical protein
VAAAGRPDLLTSLETQSAVLIAAGELLPALQSRLGNDIELLSFADVDALRALEAITTRRPPFVLLERQFATTPRGAALVNRIKADPSLCNCQIRIIPYDATTIDAAEPLAEDPAPEAPPEGGTTEPVRPVPAPELDYRGTRRAPRVRTPAGPEILVDGKGGTLVDLSTIGAQLLTPTVLKPNQRVRVSLPDTEGAGAIRCAGTVVWASFEIPKGSTPRYRVGLEFLDADAGALDAFARRHSG